MAEDNKEAMIDKFMDFAASGENPLEDGEVKTSKSNPGAKFLQRALNALNDVIQKSTGKKTAKLKEDGDMGPKTRMVTMNAIKGLPPEMKRWAVGRIQKGIADTRNTQAGIVEEAGNEAVQNISQTVNEDKIKPQY